MRADLGDFFQVVVALAVVLAGLLGGKKKPRERRPPPRLPQATPGRRVVQPAPSGARDRMLEALAAQLEEARRPTRPPDPAEAYSLEDTERVEAVSLETLEGAGEASHLRFHEEYIRPLEPVREEVQHVRRPPGGIRSAVVWAEILGPPKGLQ